MKHKAPLIYRLAYLSEAVRYYEADKTLARIIADDKTKVFLNPLVYARVDLLRDEGLVVVNQQVFVTENGIRFHSLGGFRGQCRRRLLKILVTYPFRILVALLWVCIPLLAAVALLLA